MIITIGGAPGSGKSTVGRMLATRLGLPFFSMGDIRRRYALERGMTIQQLNELAVRDPESDHLVDEYQRKLPLTESSFVLDSRLGCHFLPDSIKIYLTVDRQAAAERILTQRRDSEQWDSVEEGMAALAAREEGDRKRYMRLYGIDPCDTRIYDIVIDSTGKNPLETMEEIVRVLKERSIDLPE